MYILGVTAVEDKLQDNLKETLVAFLEAGIQFAVATGDKTETAVNIGYNCGLLNDEMKLLYVKGIEPKETYDCIKSLNETIKKEPGI